MNPLQLKIRQSKGYRWFLLGIVMIGTFMAVLDATIINAGMPTIMKSFGISVASAEWIITAYMITMTLTLPAAGWLADKYGNKRVSLAGLTVFTPGSLMMCGQAMPEPFPVASRATQGTGGGTIQALGPAIITREFPVAQRSVALGDLVGGLGGIGLFRAVVGRLYHRPFRVDESMSRSGYSAWWRAS